MGAGMWLRKLASPSLYASGSYLRSWSRAAQSLPFTVVLVYHRIAADGVRVAGRFDIENGIPARVFERQIRFMLKYFEAVECARVLEPERAPLSFAVSFDDGYADNYQVAAPILRRLGVPATFFVVSDFVGSDHLFWWEQIAAMIRATQVPVLAPGEVSPRLARGSGPPQRWALATQAQKDRTYEALCAAVRSGPNSEIPGLLTRLSAALEVPQREAGRDDALMNWDDLRTLSRQGFAIGGHTASHCNVPALDAQTLHHEIVDSTQRIENELQQPVLSFAYPYGFSDPAQLDAKRMLESAQCRVAFTGTKGVVSGHSGAYALPRARLNRAFRFAWAYNVHDALTTSRANPSSR